MSPSLTLTFSSPTPQLRGLESRCSAPADFEGKSCRNASDDLNNDLQAPLGTGNGTGNVVKIEIFNNNLNTNPHYPHPHPHKDEGKGPPLKFSKITKVKGYFCHIGFSVLDLFIAFLCYVVGIGLMFNLLFLAGLSLTLRLFVRLIFATIYHPGRYKLIERGADALWAVESGFGASSSNIVIGLKLKGVPDLSKIIKTFERKVLNFRTSLRVKKDQNGAYIQEEPKGQEYEPYEKLRWIIVEKFLFFCMKRDLDFRTERHFDLECEGPGDLETRMRLVMERSITKKMDTDKPQWHFTVVKGPPAQGPEYGLVFTIHHSYGDGISWVQMFRYAFADQPVKPSIDPMGKSPSLSSHYFSSSEKLLTRTFRWLQTVLLFPHYFSRQMVYVWRETNFFHGPFVKNNGSCRWNSNLSMKQIKGIRIPGSGGSGLSVADKPSFSALLSSCIAASFTRLFREYKARVPRNILAILPYADLPYRTLHPLNNFYSHFLPIPTSVTNSRARLVKCDKFTKSFNPPPTKPVNTLVAHLCGIMITPVQKLVGLSARSTVGFSNVPGPAERIRLFQGDEVTSLILFPPLKYRTAIVVGFISYGDQLTMSICVDETVPNHQEFATRFMAYFEEELKGLIELSQSQERDISNFNNLRNSLIAQASLSSSKGAGVEPADFEASPSNYSDEDNCNSCNNYGISPSNSADFIVNVLEREGEPGT